MGCQGRQKRQKIAALLFSGIALSSLLTACQRGNEETKLTDELASIKTRVTSKKVSHTLPKLQSPVQYTAHERKLFRELTVAGPNVNASTPLENYPLEALTLVGLMNNGSENYALISLPDKTIYQVNTSTILGNNNGHISEFGSNYIKITEGTKGSAALRSVTLQLKDSK